MAGEMAGSVRQMAARTTFTCHRNEVLLHGELSVAKDNYFNIYGLVQTGNLVGV